MLLEISSKRGSLRDVDSVMTEGNAETSTPIRVGTVPGLLGACGEAGVRAGLSKTPPPAGAGRAPANKAPLKSSRLPSSLGSPAPNLAHPLPLPTKRALCPPPCIASAAPGNPGPWQHPGSTSGFLTGYPHT